MSSRERTLSAVEVSDAIRKPSFEMQQAAIVAGYASVRDFVLAEAVEEIRALKKRVEALEANRICDDGYACLAPDCPCATKAVRIVEDDGA